MDTSDRKARILFVDDAEYVLLALKRMLFSMCAKWHMEFLSSAEAALDLARQSTFDVVVADLRMPEMRGTDLLRSVQATSPATSCLILSGGLDQEAAGETAAFGYRVIPKPCDIETLKNEISTSLQVGV